MRHLLALSSCPFVSFVGNNPFSSSGSSVGYSNSRIHERYTHGIIAKGLDGVVVDNTSISQVTSETSSLIYRGYCAQDLADQCTFEEVAYLLWNGELPTQSQLADFSRTATRPPQARSRSRSRP